MKKILALALIGAGLFAANAQTNQATLTVLLYPVQSIVVNAATSAVNLVYDDATKYSTGVTLAVNDHLTVYSTGGFQVSVSVPAATFGNGLVAPATGSTETIAASGITVQAAKGSTTNTGGSYLPAVALSATAAPLFSSTTGGVANKYNVTYKGAGANAYVGKEFAAGAAATSYTTLVTYTIIAN